MDNTLKRFLIIGFTLICLVSLGIGTYLYQTLGQLPDSAQLQGAPQYRDGQFQNEVASPPRSGGFGFILAVIRGRFEPMERPEPSVPLPSVKTNLAALDPAQDIVIWLGHSSFFVQIDGKKILIDPVFSNYAAPLPGIARAFDGTSIYTAQDMPEIDVVLITHDHYDHLDYASMKSLKPKTGLVITGVGNGAHLRLWGYPPEKIREVNWNDSLELGDGVQVHALPAQHYSGRFMERNQSLWVSFALETAERRLYFSGDTGFGPHFAQIAQRFKRFDFVTLDSGQYNEKWADIHMTPEEASRAAGILNADSLLTGHSGRFSLARHAWDEPFERALTASKGKSYRLLTPLIGEPIQLQNPDQAFTLWWKGIE
jgi:L-ascorbate metabolism protein UlaG (beta-lactamase superfamily)